MKIASISKIVAKDQLIKEFGAMIEKREEKTHSLLSRK
jgi:hypothetical protein